VKATTPVSGIFPAGHNHIIFLIANQQAGTVAKRIQCLVEQATVKLQGRYERADSEFLLAEKLLQSVL
jgi:hypothetical protein